MLGVAKVRGCKEKTSAVQIEQESQQRQNRLANKIKGRRLIAVVGVESYAAFRDENDVSL